MNKPKFNPNASFEVASAEKPKFNPNLNFEIAPASESEISKSESALRGAAQGATLGFADEISGGVEALWNKAKGNPEEFGKLYEQYRNESRANFDKAKEENPATYTAAEIGSGVATAFVPGLNIAKGASLAGTVAKSAAIGATAGTGYSEGETASEVAQDAALGATIGGVVPVAAKAAAPIAGKVASKVSSGMKGSAERFAARAMGAERGTIKKLGQEKVQEVGRYALDEKILTPLANTDDKVARNAATQARSGAKMDEVYGAIDDAGKSTFNPLEVAGKVDSELGDFYRSPINRSESNQLENTLESILMRGDKNISLKEAQKLKQELGKVAKWKNNQNVTDKEQMARDAYRIVRDAINEAAEKGANELDQKELSGVLKESLSTYSNSKAADELLTNKLAREQGNKLMGLTDWALAAGSLPAAVSTGGTSIPIAITALGTKKLAEKYGAQNAALLLDKASRGIVSTPKAIETVARKPVVAQQLFGNTNANSIPLPKVAEEKRKGPEKWARDGFENVKSDLGDSARIDTFKKTKKGRDLLIRASSLKKGSKAYVSVIEQLKKLEEQDG